MCGLTLSIHRYPPTEQHQALLESLFTACAARGPDAQSTYRYRFETDDGTFIEVLLSASVLGLRGGVIQQPLVGERGVLGWNGQVRPMSPHARIVVLTMAQRCSTDSMLG